MADGTLLAMSAEGLLLMILPMAGAGLLAYGIFQAFRDLRKTDQKRMVERLREKGGGTGQRRDEDVKSQLLRRRAMMDHVGGLDQIFAKFSFVPKLQIMLDQADVDWMASRMLFNLLSASAGAFCVLLVVGVGLIGAFAASVSAIVLPLMWLLFRRKRRMNKLLTQLPDVFELISQALRAGHSLASGIHLVSQQMPDPAGTEFGRVFHEQNLGIKIEEALKDMASRVDLLDVRFFVTAVLIQRQTGGDLAEVLDKISGVIRGRIELFGEVKTLTAEGRLSGWTLLALPVLVFIALQFLNPAYAEVLLYDRTGRMMLITAIVMQLMGMAMINKIVNIKV